MNTPLKIYLHPKCSTCKKATDWLTVNAVTYEPVDIRTDAPSLAELQAMREHVSSISKLFNTSGMEYQKLGLKDRLPDMSEDEALQLLSTNGMLVKRPFALGNASGVTGFKEAEWAKAFRARLSPKNVMPPHSHEDQGRK